MRLREVDERVVEPLPRVERRRHVSELRSSSELDVNAGLRVPNRSTYHPRK
jgi:hypothetical protein